MNSNSSIAEVTKESFEQQVLRAQRPVLVAVCANGSRASEKMLTLLETWTRETRARLTLLRVDAVVSPELAQRCGVPSVPGVALFTGGTACYQFSGELSRHELQDLLFRAKLLARSATPLANLGAHPTAQTA